MVLSTKDRWRAIYPQGYRLQPVSEASDAAMLQKVGVWFHKWLVFDQLIQTVYLDQKVRDGKASDAEKDLIERHKQDLVDDALFMRRMLAEQVRLGARRYRMALHTCSLPHIDA